MQSHSSCVPRKKRGSESGIGSLRRVGEKKSILAYSSYSSGN